MNNKLKLYHYSNDDFDIIRPVYFGKNLYTYNDVKACQIARSFFYLTDTPFEYRFKNSKYIYMTEIDTKNLYDLRTDRDGLKTRYKNDIKGLLSYCKRHYKGIVYHVGFDIVCLFYSVKAYRLVTL